MTNSVLQYNYSHNNDGGGFVFAQYRGALPFHHNVIRYNVSENDGRRNYYSGIFVWSASDYGIADSQVYNNTVYVTPSKFAIPSGVVIASKTSNVAIRNNIIVATSGLPLLSAAAGQDGMLIQGNDYWTRGAPFLIQWNGTDHRSLASFRAAGQERVGALSVGLDVDPQLTDPGKGVTFDGASDLETLAGYKLEPSSPLLGKGLDLKQTFGIAVGERDYYGSEIPADRQFEIGAHEFINMQTANVVDSERTQN
jgi:hypothetical protein